MTYDPVKKLYYTIFECCSGGQKVKVIHYYNLKQDTKECSKYVLADGTLTSNEPAGLDCSC